MSLIEVENLVKTYRVTKRPPGLWAAVRGLVSRETTEVQAVRGIGFTIEPGELVGFLGPNGAGKTTTLKILSGIVYPTAGSALVAGFIPAERRPEYQRRFALVMGQKNQLWWDLPPTDSFLLYKEIYELGDREYREILAELAEVLEIGHVLATPVRKMSLGERMKCELAAALLHRPEILFLDEPTIGLDVVAQKNVRDFIRRINEEKKTTIILTSHYMEDISQLCERVIIIDQGAIAYDGRLADLVREWAPNKTLTITFNDQGVSRAAIEGFGEIVKFDPYEAVISVPRAATKTAARRILESDLPVDDILINEAEVDDVIRRIYGGL